MKNNFMTRLVLVLSVLILGGCNLTDPELAEYKPPKESPFRITFSYPAKWELVTAAHNPAVMFAYIYPETSVANITIFLGVTPASSPESEMAFDIKRFLNTTTGPTQNKIVHEDRILQIDGHEARWFVMETTSKYAGSERPYISEDIFILGEGQYYRIGLRFSKKETNLQFHSEFEAMIASIKFLP